MASTVKLDCNACKQEKSMVATKVSKMSPIVVFIGWILALPSMFGILVAVIMLFASVSAGNEVGAQAASQAEAAGAAIGAGIGIGMAVFVGIFSLVGGLLGYLLIMKKKVYKCVSCGFIMDRA
jgi:hypothetical protein